MIGVYEYGPDDCEPSEPGKHWLAIEDENPAGIEYCVIVVREPHEITEEHWNRANYIARCLGGYSG